MLPQAWTSQYSNVFSLEDAQNKHSHRVSAAHPVCLHTVVLQPVAPGTSRDDASRLIDWLSSTMTILKTGSTLNAKTENTAGSGVSFVQFKVNMTEPATSGYIDTCSTRVVLLQEPIQSQSTVRGDHDLHSISSDDDDGSIYDIDERFLSNSIDARVNSDVQVSLCGAMLAFY